VRIAAAVASATPGSYAEVEIPFAPKPAEIATTVSPGCASRPRELQREAPIDAEMEGSCRHAAIRCIASHAILKPLERANGC
jgi:hypothetical protein